MMTEKLIKTIDDLHHLKILKSFEITFVRALQAAYEAGNRKPTHELYPKVP